MNFANFQVKKKASLFYNAKKICETKLRMQVRKWTDDICFIDSPYDWLDNLLKEKLSKAPSDDAKNNDENLGVKDHDEVLDVRWTYATKGLELLAQLKDTLKDKKESLSETLSVSQQQNVSSLTQLVIALGIVPSLLPGE